MPNVNALQIAVPKKKVEEKKCYVCGGTNHDFNKCKYELAKCEFCGKIGHGSMACEKNPAVQQMVRIRAARRMAENSVQPKIPQSAKPANKVKFRKMDAKCD